MILADVNVLIYAFRDDSPGHAQHRAWLERCVAGPEPYAVSPQVLAALVRITTHPKIFARPSARQDAFAFADALLEQPNAIVVMPGPRHWQVFRDLCAAADTKGNLVQDAWFAALAIESGCEWITLDRDFARFPGLRWRTP